MKVIVYSGYVRLMQADELGASADAYLEKGDDDAPLIAAIRAVTSALTSAPVGVNGTRRTSAQPSASSCSCVATAPLD